MVGPKKTAKTSPAAKEPAKRGTKRNAPLKKKVTKKSRKDPQDSDEGSDSSSEMSASSSWSSSASRSSRSSDRSDRKRAGSSRTWQADAQGTMNSLKKMSKEISKDVKGIKSYLSSLLEGKELFNRDMEQMVKESTSFVPCGHVDYQNAHDQRGIVFKYERNDMDLWNGLEGANEGMEMQQCGSSGELGAARCQSMPNLPNEEEQPGDGKEN